MRWMELEKKSRRLVDRLRNELGGVDLVTLEDSDAAEMAAQLLDRAALRELRQDDPAFVREVVREDGLDDLHDGAFDEALRASVLERMCGVMFVRLLEQRSGARTRGRVFDRDPRPLAR